MKLAGVGAATLASAASAQPCGDVWTQWNGTSIPARANYALAFDSARQRVVLFGGSQGAAAHSTMWM